MPPKKTKAPRALPTGIQPPTGAHPSNLYKWALEVTAALNAAAPKAEPKDDQDDEDGK